MRHRDVLLRQVVSGRELERTILGHACYILAGTFKGTGQPKGQSHTLTRRKDVYCLVAMTFECDKAIHKVDSDSVIRTARPKVPRVLLYADLAAHRVTASVSVVIAQLQRLRQEGSTL